MIAHHENKAENEPGYNALKRKYENRNHNELSDYMYNISESIKGDLSKSKIFVDEFKKN